MLRNPHERVKGRVTLTWVMLIQDVSHPFRMKWVVRPVRMEGALAPRLVREIVGGLEGVVLQAVSGKLPDRWINAGLVISTTDEKGRDERKRFKRGESRNSLS